ncbi:MAG: FapA family protein [Pseudomonadota bacterium]
MKGSKKKTFDSLEDAYLEALETPEISPQEIVRAGDDETGQGVALSGGETDLLASPDNPFRNVKGWQDKQMLLSPDHMTLSLVIKAGGDPISIERIQLALQKFGIVHGINEEALKIAETLSQRPDKKKVLLARGTPAQLQNTFFFSFDPEPPTASSPLPSLTDGHNLDFSQLKSVFSAPDLATIQAAALQVKAVNPGEIFLKAQKFPDAKPGMDLFGQELECPEATLPESGNHVHFDEKKSGYEANIYGYVLVENKTVSIIPPLWISPDRTTAYYIFLPQIPPFRFPSISEIKHMISQMGIEERCINAVMLEKMVGRMAAGLPMPRVIKLAETVPPVNGADAVLNLFIDAEKKAGKMRSNGSIDLRERNAVVSIPEGNLIGEKNLASKGVDGCTLFGKLIKAKAGTDKPVNIGEGVKVIKKDDRIQYFAARNGNIKFVSNTLTVTDIYEIDGDIDYHTGNIDLKTDILIKGSVLSGFSVKSEGDVAIMGSIENGATVTAQGNLTVDKGILGENTKVVVRGNLAAGYIQDAEVIVKGEAVVKSYLFNALVLANGPISVLKGEGRKSGSAVGGLICSSRAIRLCVIGSPGNASTIIAVRPDPAVNAQFKALEEEKQACSASIAKISNSLPLESFEPEEIKALLAGLPSPKKEEIVVLLSNLNKLIKRRKTLIGHIDTMRTRIEAAQANARIQVTERVYPGSEIHIGEKKLAVSAEMGPSLFKLHEQQIVRN